MISSEEEEEEGTKATKEESSLMVEEKELELALNSSSVDGLSSPKTMKFFGEVGGRRVVVLLDSGATHSFISKKLAEELNLPVTLARFVVTLGDERKIKGMGKCKLVEIKSQGVSIIHEFFLFELDSIEIILEVD